MTSYAILAEGLRKSFGKIRALDGLDLHAEEGTILGVLGPNGAGKTTAVRILATLLRPDGGHAEVAGLDVVKHPSEVRRRIGLAGQYAAVDEDLTGSENLRMFGQLYHLSGARATQRADELLASFDLTEAAGRLVKTYSGGMRRRLDLAASLIVSPPILFLDEPTTGLDPRGRLAVWNVIGDLAARGTTILLTTQYMDEADHLADQIAVVDRGRVIATGTAAELKDQIGGERLDVTLAPGADVQAALGALARSASGAIAVDDEGHHLTVPVTPGTRRLADTIGDLDAAGLEVKEFALRRPTLDEVFLALTGRNPTDPKSARGPKATETVAL
jgi:ABC-2 type transport system ATP-binding protein